MNKLLVDLFIILLIIYGASCGSATDATTNATDTIPTTTDVAGHRFTDHATNKDQGIESTTMPYDVSTSTEFSTDVTDTSPAFTDPVPDLGSRIRSGVEAVAESETSTATVSIENSTDINLDSIKKEVLRFLEPTKEIIKISEETSTLKPVDPVSTDASAQKSVTKGEAAGILVGALIIAIALICVTKILYNRYKMKTYDVAQNNIELCNP